MKPDFALEFTDKSVVLLHRTARGWLNIGEAALDSADLDGAIEYLRKTALELSPGGFTTKLVIPNAQILYAEIPVPDGSDKEIRATIIKALVARTPYAAEEIAFDWQGAGRGAARVAAVARDTLAEAEGFASQHRLNPASFVAIPPDAAFEGEPWFGAPSAQHLPEGESLERDEAAITRVGEGTRAARAKSGARKDSSPDTARPESAPAASEAKPAGHGSEAAPRGDTEGPQRSASPAPGPATVPVADPALSRPHAGTTQPAEAPARTAAPTAASAGVTTDARTEAIAEAPYAHVSGPGTPADAPTPAANGHVASTAPAARPPAAPAAPPPEARPAARDDRPATARHADAADDDTDGLPPAPAPAILAARAARAAAASPEPVRDARIHESQTHDDRPPVRDPAAFSAPQASAVAPAAPRHTETLRPPASPPASPLAAAPVAAPPSAAVGPAAASASPATSATVQTPAPDVAAMPFVSAPGEARTATARIAAQPQARPPAHARVTAQPRPKPAQRAPAPGQTPAGDKARGGPATGPFASRQGQRGKPRHLGLILTAILLLCLALVAAWSSFYLASETSTAPDPVAVAAGDDVTPPAPEAELAAAEPAATLPSTDDAAPPLPEGDEIAVTGAESASEASPDIAGDAPEAGHRASTAEEALLASIDSVPAAFDLLELPQPASTAEAAPDAPMPPPPAGMVYQFDADGLIVPVPEGIPSPDGYTIRSGQPSKLPPERSAEVAAAAAAAATATEAASADAPADDDAVSASEPLAAGPDAVADSAADPAIADPDAAAVAAEPGPDEGSAPVVAETTAEDGASAVAAETVVEAPADVDPGLASARPKPRPGAAVDAVPATADDDASIPSDAARDFAAATPRARPGEILATAAKAASAREQTAAASLAGGMAGDAPEAALPEAAAPEVAVNPALVTVAMRPAARPAGLSRAVDAAISAALQEPPAAVAVAQPAAQPSAEENAEVDEPEIAAASAPSVPTRANVAKEATFAKAISLSKTSLIGVYGTPSNRHALVRMGNGKITKVKVGDRLDGGVVQAITQNEVRYQKGKKLYALAMPAG